MEIVQYYTVRLEYTIPEYDDNVQPDTKAVSAIMQSALCEKSLEIKEALGEAITNKGMLIFVDFLDEGE